MIVNPAINELTLPQVKAQFSTSFQSTGLTVTTTPSVAGYERALVYTAGCTGSAGKGNYYVEVWKNDKKDFSVEIDPTTTFTVPAGRYEVKCFDRSRKCDGSACQIGSTKQITIVWELYSFRSLYGD